MSFKQMDFSKENAEPKPRPPHKVLQDLRNLQSAYFRCESDDGKATIEQRQR
jgi:hypothetical protein